MIDLDRSKKGRFILTGSSSPEIIKGLTESLACRIATVELRPFKTSEYIGAEIKKYHEEQMKGKVLTAIAVDELETFVHSKALPVSVGLAVDTATRQVIRVDFAKFPMKGALGKKISLPLPFIQN